MGADLQKKKNSQLNNLKCFRHNFQKLKNQTADVTRNTVQKSVCVLSTVPLYGHVQVKMALITHAYFEEGDFSKVSLLQDTYHHLNSCLSQIEDLSGASQLFVGKMKSEQLVILHSSPYFSWWAELVIL